MAIFWMQVPFMLMQELAQRKQEGCDVSRLEPEILAINEHTPLSKLEALYDQLQALEVSPSFEYEEPSDLPSIQKARPAPSPLPEMKLTPVQLQDRIYGAWLGRSAGCTLGKPVEGLTRAQIYTYLTAAGAYPLNDFVPLLDPIPEGIQLHPSYVDTVRGTVQYMSRDDDTDYTIVGLHVLEKYGPGFTTENVSDAWLNVFPYNMVFTAERVAYRNLCNDVPIPQAAFYRNPFREWIGAQIRADGFAYAAAGNPALAAELGYRDAALSHVKNGIYGEMMAAAMIAAAFATDDVNTIIQAGLSQIPAKSRLAVMMQQVLEWSRNCSTWQEAFAEVEKSCGHYFWVHTINNAAIVLLALLYGNGDYAQSIAISVMAGWDTDCNGATVGSILGAMKGASSLPPAWTSPLNDVMHSAVFGFDNTRISDLAARSYKTWQALNS
jgi:ADP-ribosylglycohydrolase